MYYAIYKIATGELTQVRQSFDPNLLTDDLAFKQIGMTRPDPEQYVWDTITLDFVPRVKTKAELEAVLPEFHKVWQMWADTLAEAESRALPANVITALLTKTNSAWSNYVNAIDAWRSA